MNKEIHVVKVHVDVYVKRTVQNKKYLEDFKKPFVHAVTSRFVSFLHNLQNV